MTIYNLGFVKELVNAFNISNYGSKVNTNFVVEGDNIVVKFNCDKGSAEKYLSQMARDLVREYYSDESVARHAFDLGSLPFNFDKGKWTYSGAVTKLTVPIDNGVIFNLKVHFAEGFEIGVKNQMIKAIDEKHHLGKKRIEETLNASIKQAKMDPSSSYIKCLLFYDTNVQKYFVKALQAQMNEYGYNYLDFYDIDYEDKKIYFKDVENIGFIRSVTEISKKKTAYNFNLQGVGNLKVKSERYKGAIGELIFRLAGVSICGYYRDNFISKDRISKGDNFAFIPMVKEGNGLRYLNYMEADKINAKFSHDLFTNVRGQTETTRSGRFGGVYAFSDRQIALLIPVIIENSVINKDGQIEIDPELVRALSRSPSTKLDSPRHESGVLRHNVGAAEVVAAKNVQGACGRSLAPLAKPEDTRGDLGSNNEYSKAELKKSQSPEKKHGGGWFCKERKKSSPLKRRSVERDTMCSSKSDLVYHVTEKSSVSKPFFSFPTRIKAKSNPPSEVTSPTHEGASGGLKPLTSDERKELRPFLSPELQKKLDSGSLEDAQIKYLLYTPSGQEKMKKNFESQEENLRRSVNVQLPANPSFKRDSGYSSGLPASPAVPHKESVSSGFKECEVEPVSEALRK